MTGIFDSRPKKQTKRAEPKICPTCWNDMRCTTEGYVCPRHGLVVARPEPVLRPRKSPSRAQRTRRVSGPPRGPNQTDRLNAKRGEITSRNQAGESLASIAADMWQDLGYASAHVCASKLSRYLGLSGIGAAAHVSGPRPGSTPTRRFTAERFAELQTAIDAGEPVWAFAGKCWQEWGFQSRSACDSLLRKWLRTKAKGAA